MAKVKPFKAIRPAEGKADIISCVPYDVLNEHEAREIIESAPNSFLRVTRPEAAISVVNAGDVDPLKEARESLEWLINAGLLVEESQPCFYIYRLTQNGRQQTGIVGCCSIDDYDAGVIKKHEKTRPDKVKDRTDHMLAVGAQTGLIFLAFRNTAEMAALIAEAVKQTPEYDFVCSTGTRQTVWIVSDTQPIETAFENIPSIYVADGHHRAESASLARKTLRSNDPDHTGDEEYNFVVAGIFPSEDLHILAYNRVVKDLNGLSEDEFFDRLREKFVVTESDVPTPDKQGVFCMYLGGKWHRLEFIAADSNRSDVLQQLDVSILQQNVLDPLLGITDPRTNERINFIGGGRGTEELIRLVDGGDAAVAFSLYPTSMNDLLAVSDNNETMPPKSTWFEPKMEDGLFTHRI